MASDISHDEALERLRRAGLVVRMKDAIFVGGRSARESGGIRYVEHAFSIDPQAAGGYVILLSGNGQRVEERASATLRAAVEAVEAWQARG